MGDGVTDAGSGGTSKIDDKPIEKGGENDCSNGPIQKRGCTDLFCCLFFVAHWIVFLVLSAIAISNGNPTRLISHRDFKGAFCGQKDNWNPWNKNLKIGTTGPNSGGINSPRWDRTGYEKMLYTMNMDGFMDLVNIRSNMCFIVGPQTNPIYLSMVSADASFAAAYTKACGGGSTGAAPSSNPAGAVQSMTDPNKLKEQLVGMFSGGGLMSAIEKYFHKACVKSCTEVSTYASSDQAVPTSGFNTETSNRFFYYTPKVSEDHYEMFRLIVKIGLDTSLSGITQIQRDVIKDTVLSLIASRALPKTICPEEAQYCIPYPGMGYSDLANFCVFKVPTSGAVGDALNSSINGGFASGADSSVGTYVGDIGVAWPAILLTAIFSIVMGFLFMTFLRFAAGILVWSAVGSVFAVLAGTALYFWTQSQCTMTDVNSRNVTVPPTAAPAGSGTSSGTITPNSTSTNSAGTMTATTGVPSGNGTNSTRLLLEAVGTMAVDSVGVAAVGALASVGAYAVSDLNGIKSAGIEANSLGFETIENQVEASDNSNGESLSHSTVDDDVANVWSPSSSSSSSMQLTNLGQLGEDAVGNLDGNLPQDYDSLAERFPALANRKFDETFLERLRLRGMEPVDHEKGVLAGIQTAAGDPVEDEYRDGGSKDGSRSSTSSLTIAPKNSDYYDDSNLYADSYDKNDSYNRRSRLRQYTDHTGNIRGLQTTSGTTKSTVKKCVEENRTMRDVYKGMAIFMGVITMLFVLFILCSCNAIRLGIAITKVAAKFIYQNKSVVLIPLVQMFLTLVWILIWMVAVLHIVSSVADGSLPEGPFSKLEALGNLTTVGKCNGSYPAGYAYADNDTVGALNTATENWRERATNSNCLGTTPTDTAKDKCFRCSLPRFDVSAGFAFAFFSLLWNNAFLVALAQVVLAGAVAFWYFTPNDEKGKKNVLLPSVSIAFKYHTGSMAFGSFILACVQFAKWVMWYIQRQAESQKNFIGAALARIARCLIECFERFVKWLNKMAYIQIAVMGKNFCRSAWNGFCLFMRNIRRTSILATIGGGMHYIGVFFICGGTLCIGYFILISLHGNDISSPIVPMFLFLVIGYCSSQLFMLVFMMGIDATMACFLADEEIHNGAGAGGAQFTPDELKEFVSDASPIKKDDKGGAGNQA